MVFWMVSSGPSRAVVRAVPLTASPMLLAYRATTVTWYSVSGRRFCSRTLVSPAGTLTSRRSLGSGCPRPVRGVYWTL